MSSNNIIPYIGTAASRKQRRLVAILYADAVGFTRLAEQSEDRALEALEQARKHFQAVIAAHEGRVVGTPGDAILAEFSSVAESVSAAVEVQQTMARQTVSETESTLTLSFRIGIHLGDIVPDGADILGEGVNLASRIEAVADSGGICISSSVYEQVRDKLALSYLDLGEIELKNVSRPVRLFKVNWSEPATGSNRTSTNGASPLSARPTIAVLPFANLSEHQDEQYFADGITDNVINSLACSRWFIVIGRGSTFRFRNANKDPREVGRELGARYILEGSVQRYKSRARVVTHLIDASSGHLIKSQRHDESLKDVLKLQDAIAIQIASALELDVLNAESIKPPSAGNVGALDHVFRAYAKLWEMSPSSTQAATDSLERAVQLAPIMAQAHLGLAMAALLTVYMGWTDRADEEVTKAYKHATRAIELDRNDAWAHMALGVVGLQTANVAGAISELRKAVQLNPSLALGYGFLGNALAFQGDHNEAGDVLKFALKLSPRDPFLFYWFDALAMVHILAGQWTEAALYAQRAGEENPRWPGAFRMLAVANGLSGKTELAQLALAQMLQLQPEISLPYLRRILPFKNQAHFDLIVRGLHAAGWADEAT